MSEESDCDGDNGEMLKIHSGRSLGLSQQLVQKAWHHQLALQRQIGISGIITNACRNTEPVKLNIMVRCMQVYMILDA